MTSPDEQVPDGALSDTGLAALAAKTQEDWENELNADWTETLDPLTQLFGIVTEAFLGVAETVIGWFSELIDLAGFLEVLQQVIEFFYDIANRSGFLAVFQSVIDFFMWLWDLLETLLGGAFDAVEDFLKPIFGLFANLFGAFGELFLPIVEAAIGFLSWLWDSVETIFGEAFDAVDDFLKPVGEFFLNIVDAFGANIVLPILEAVTGFLAWLWDLVETVFGGAFDVVDDFLKPVFQFFADILEDFGSIAAGLPSLGSDVVNGLWSLLNGGAEGVGRTINDVLESVGSFVSSLIPNLTGIPGALSLGDVSTWANNLLTKGLSWQDFKTLFGEIPDDIMGVIPLPNISLINPELMAQGGFDTSSTLDPGSGWEWHTDTHSGSGGSARVAGNGTVRTLYSNQSISVTAGDQVNISCWTKSTGTVAASSIVLSVIPVTGTTPGTAVTLASRGSSASWVQMAPSTYTVGSGVTSLRVSVGVTAGASSGSYVWFDDISVKKTGLLSGDWMQGQLGTIAQDIQGAVDQIVRAIKGVGVTGTLVSGSANSIQSAVQQIFKTLFGPLISLLPTSLVSNPLLEIAIPGLQAGKITSGTFGTSFIANDAINADKIANNSITTDLLASATFSGIGAVINPGVGSGATLTRTGTTAYSSTSGRNVIGTGFYNSLSSSADITALTSGGSYTGQFQVSMNGWYLCEIGYKIEPTSGFNWNIAPLLYKNGSPFRVGSDAMLVNATFYNQQRFTQSSFIVYLTAGQNVGAGYDANGAFTDIFSGSGTAVDTYFSVSLLNKSYA